MMRLRAPRALRVTANNCLFTRPSLRSFSNTSLRRSQERQWSTPLAERLFKAISTTGPVPLASYMRMCLTGDLAGYYTGAIGKDRDQFGTKGDFVTSPEISQVFGELVGVWFIAEWMSQGRPSKGVQLIEIGPGRGTLMDDILRTMQRFPAMAESVDSVYMVEAGKELQSTQRNLLCGFNSDTTQLSTGMQSISKYGKTPIVWTDSINSIPIEPDKMPFILAHEFFDALPIHTFQSAPVSTPASTKGTKDSGTSHPASARPSTNVPKESTEWREMLVGVTSPGTTHADLGTPKSQQDEAPPAFQLVLSSTTTRHSRLLPEISPRYRALKPIEGSVVEVCPEAYTFAADFAARIGGSEKHPKPKPSGAALVLDYGTSDTVPINSLRGIRQHKIVNPFSAPGLVDLSADVDFTAIAEAATMASEGVEVHGPVRQGDFLEVMGIRQRAEVLARAPSIGKEAAERIDKSWKRLVDRGPGGMGRLYKVLAIVPENDGRRRPVGFGGDVM